MLLAVALLFAAPVSVALAAGDGHNHGGGREIITMAPRAEARLGDKQLVVLYAGGRLIAFLESFVDAEPTRGAELEATVNFIAEPLTEAGPGLYRSGPMSLGGGRNEIEIAWKVGGESGTATLFVEIAATSANTAADLTALPVPKVPGWAFLLAAALLYAGATLLFLLRARRRGRDEAHDATMPVPGAPSHAPQPRSAE
jgi:hypothetical protein